MEPPDPLALAATGAALGWGVAWVPGPINAEILRRGARDGFAAAFVVGAGASCGDFLWALALSLGAGSLAESPAVQRVLAGTSAVLLAGLAFLFLRGAWRSLAAARRGEGAPPGPALFESRRGGWLLGFLAALTSPFNMAFWLGVAGQQAARGAGPGLSLLFAGSVVAGALSWCVVLSTASRYGARLPSAAWDAALRAVAAGFLLWLAARTALVLTAS